MKVLSPEEQARLTLAMCEEMGYTFEQAEKETKVALDDQRADPQWREAWEKRRVLS